MVTLFVLILCIGSLLIMNNQIINKSKNSLVSQVKINSLGIINDINETFKSQIDMGISNLLMPTAYSI